MKKIFTLAAILFSVTTFAAEYPRPNAGKVNIRSNSDAFIQVVIDGRQYNMNRNGFVMDNIMPGRHCIEVYRIDNYGMFRRRPQMIYSNNMVVRPWESLNININRMENVWVESRFDRDNDRYNGYGNGRDGYGRDGYGRDRDRDHGDYNNGPVYNDHDGSYRH